MKKIVKGILIATKWGYAINFEGKLAFLTYGGNVRELELGKEYACEIYYRIIYAQTPNKGNKNWSFLDGSNLEEISRHSEFKKFNLNIKNAYPNFFIKT